MGLGRESGRRIRFEGWDVCVHPYDLTPWYDESYVFIWLISTDSSGVAAVESNANR